MKILILLPYYNRPNMVRFALDSIAAQNYDDYHVAIIDDGSVTPIRSVLDDYLWTREVVSIYETDDSIEQKLMQGGSRHGQFINQAIDESDADIGIILCDDDALYPGYLGGLSEFYEQSPYTAYSYGHVVEFNPYTTSKYSSIFKVGESPLNHLVPINPYCTVDASQVSWRLEPYKAEVIRFPSPQTAALDSIVYEQMYKAFGHCMFNGLTAQYKGVFIDQMGVREDPYTPRDKESYGN